MEYSVRVPQLTDNLPGVVDAGQIGRSRARGIDGGKTVGTRRRPLERFCEGFAVELLDHPKAAKLALHTVPIAMVIAICGCEPAFGKLVDGLHARDDLNWK